MLSPPGSDDAAPVFSWIGTWGKPPDDVAWAALAVGAALLVLAIAPGGPRWLAGLLDFAAIDDLSRRRRILTMGAFAAAFLSLGYVAYYLHGSPQSLEAAAHFLQGRALSRGQLSWAVNEPSASFRTPLVLYDAATSRAAPIFPPGLALLLAVGFRVGAPLIVGPCLAATIAIATYVLAREIALREPLLARAATESPFGAEATARVAVGLSIVCATLRFHTAETLPHATCALAITTALAAALYARRHGRASAFFVAGLGVGWALASRPLGGLAATAVVAALGAGFPIKRWRALFLLVLGAAPLVLLWAAANHAATGSALRLPEIAYYDASDGPPGCFRYGIGSGIGCVVQQAHEAARGFGASAAALVTAHRLRAHLADVLDFEPLALLALVPLFARARTNRAPLLLGLVVLGQIVLHVPWFVEGVSDGAGARPYAELLPIEHALAAVGIAQLWPRVALARKALAVLGLACLGFAVHGAHAHARMARAGSAQPAYRSDVPREANVTSGLLYFASDEGFDLAFLPEMQPSHGILAARERDDDRDRLLYDLFGHPGAHRYVVSETEGATSPFWAPNPPTSYGGQETWRFESEAEWPPAAQRGAWSAPESRLVGAVATGGSCASNGHVLTVTPADPTAPGEVTITLPIPHEGRWRILPRVFKRGGLGMAKLELRRGDTVLATWDWRDALLSPTAADVDGCVHLGGEELAFANADRPTLVVRAERGLVAIDRVDVVGPLP